MSEALERSLTRRTIIACATGGLIIVAYLLVASLVTDLPGVRAALTDLAGRGPLPGIPILWFTIFAALMLPFSSAALFILIGLEVLSPNAVFWTAFTAGTAATITTYGVGRKARSLVHAPKLERAIAEAQAQLESRRRIAGLLTFVLRAVPNPLYDAWGYACGIVRVPFSIYLVASVAGGVIPLALLCFVVQKAQ